MKINSLLVFFLCGLHCMMLSSVGVAAQEGTNEKSLHSIARSLPNATLVEWLKDDDIRWNAAAAGLELVKRSKQVSQQKELIELLEPHLLSEDSQIRQVAVGVLQRIGRVDVGAAPIRKGANVYAPNAALMSASIRELNNYTTCHYPKWIGGSATQRDCVTYLLKVGPRQLKMLVPMLHKAMDGKLKRERWIYAFILASIGSTERFEQLTDLLSGQLVDNYIEEDALMCLNALYRMGDRVIPFAEATLKVSTDAQQQASLKLLLLELRTKDGDVVSSKGSSVWNLLTWKCDNPIRSWRFGRDSH
jgi:hypothetical protein